MEPVQKKSLIFYILSVCLGFLTPSVLDFIDQPSVDPSPVIVAPDQDIPPTPVRATVLHSFVTDQKGNVLDPASNESVSRFTWLADSKVRGTFTVHSAIVGLPVMTLPVSVGESSPLPVPVPPGPTPPEPPAPPTPPKPSDAFVSSVKNAYVADNPYNSVALDQLIKGYAMAIMAIDDPTNDTLGKLYSAVNIAVRNAAGGESLPNTRTVLATEADKFLPHSGVLDSAARSKIKTQFMRAKSALEACK